MRMVSTQKRAYPQQTPHSERHFQPSHPQIQPKNRYSTNIPILSRVTNKLKRPSRRRKHKRFMEGWYYRLTLPNGVSFAFIFSIEDPGRRDEDYKKGETPLRLAAVQVMGPDDEYVVQSDPDDTKFWAFEDVQAFGCNFEYFADKQKEGGKQENLEMEMDPDEWNTRVKSGFQVLPNRLQGKVLGHDGSMGGVGPNQGIPRECTFDFSLKPLSGWGDDETIKVYDDDDDNTPTPKRSKQKSTAGWLASYSVFEPHWQVTLADARASGTATWDGTTYQFENAPLYAEKNWGGAFPSKWYWAQCNAFDGYDGDEKQGERLTVTAGGGTRKIPFGRTEDLGMVSVHHNGIFYEAVPWTGEMKWEVRPWGEWKLSGRCTEGQRLFEVELVAVCDVQKVPGVVLRTPTKEDGLAYFCRDSFYANATLSLYQLEWDADVKEFVRAKGKNPIVDRAVSSQCAVEVGGGPWWDTWKGTSRMKQPLKGLVKLPYLFDNLRKRWSNRRNK